MSSIYWILLVNLNQCFPSVVDLLIESGCSFFAINLFDVTCVSSSASWYIPPVLPPTISEINPVGEFAFVLLAT
jgi:hypothetical protein